MNLLLNAAPAMHGHGRIAVVMAQRDRQRVLEIGDSGPGIPPELRERVFDPFFTTKVRGGGLGLPIARRTAELRSGTLTLACPDGGGTTLTLTAPLRARTYQATGDAARAISERLSALSLVRPNFSMR